MSLVMLRRLFVATMLVQGFHMLEHFLQVAQQSLGIVPAHGLIGALDLEWVHFLYNGAYLILLAVLCVGIGLRYILPSRIPHRRMLFTILALTTLWQGYHMVEHIVKLQQHLATGMEGTPGLLGAHLDLVWFHFFLNAAVYVPLLYIFHRLKPFLFHRSETPLCEAHPCPWLLMISGKRGRTRSKALGRVLTIVPSPTRFSPIPSSQELATPRRSTSKKLAGVIAALSILRMCRRR